MIITDKKRISQVAKVMRRRTSIFLTISRMNILKNHKYGKKTSMRGQKATPLSTAERYLRSPEIIKYQGIMWLDFCMI